eukprot:582697-Hanusia_phi.AAC.3
MAGEKGMLEDMWESLTNASNEAIEIFKSAFNVTGAIPTKPKPGKMFYFGDPSDFDMADLSANPSQWMQFKNSVKGFVSAVEWTEKWIIALGVFHIMMLLLAVPRTRVCYTDLTRIAADPQQETHQRPDGALLLPDGLHLLG